jgi:pilus assembly protein TadC
MTLELLRQNIEQESQLVKNILELKSKKDNLASSAASGVQINSQELQAVDSSIKQLASQLKIVNNAIPDTIKDIQFYKNLTAKDDARKTDLYNIRYRDEDRNELSLAIKKNEHKKFLELLSLHDFTKRKIQTDKKEEEKASSVDQFSKYIKLSNKLFRNTANKLVASGSFDALRLDLIRITSPLIINSYVAIMLFTTMVAFFAGLLLVPILLLLGVSIIISVLMPLIVPITAFILFYIYPSSKRKNLEKEINQELPFLIIYMAAIATSGIEPSKIFQIIVTSKDYPVTQREIKKLTNYINFYGYDLVAALKAVAKNCPSDRMAQLFDGLATTITSGGELTTFLGKHSESLLFDYRLEREKYTRTAETFMNIYISVVIAAPMIMMMIFILMSLGNFGGDYLSPTNIGLVTILGISFLNMGFLIFLNLKQPKF